VSRGSVDILSYGIGQIATLRRIFRPNQLCYCSPRCHGLKAAVQSLDQWEAASLPILLIVGAVLLVELSEHRLHCLIVLRLEQLVRKAHSPKCSVHRKTHHIRYGFSVNQVIKADDHIKFLPILSKCGSILRLMGRGVQQAL
jgi:hypothetical protein